MRLAFFSDVHANLAALQAVLQDIETQQVERIFCLGDIVGYFAQPKECLDLLRKSSLPIHHVRGNHELLLRDECWREDCENELVLPGIVQADKVLSDEDVEFLQSLPSYQQFDNFGIAISHDTLTQPGNGRYVSYRGDDYGDEPCYSQLKFMAPEVRIGFLGHTHVPYVYESVPGQLRANNHEYDRAEDCVVMPILAEARYIINPGSVGQPRDRDNRAAYGLLELTESGSTYELRRIPYDLEATISSIDSLPTADESTLNRLKRRLISGW